VQLTAFLLLPEGSNTGTPHSKVLEEKNKNQNFFPYKSSLLTCKYKHVAGMHQQQYFVTVVSNLSSF